MSQVGILQPFLLDGIRQVGSTIGDGSYASTVVPLSFRGLKCAGKKPLHTKHYDNASPQEKKRMLERFQEECQLLNGLKHPNIMQFIGIYFDEGSSLPVLVMECLHCTLSESLKRYGVMQERVSLGILDDVVTGLCYLHGHRPPIVHRSLTASNVFLSAGEMRAKISDIGVAKILSMTPAKINQLTNCPGKPPYMPPEALKEDPEYSTKTDCFSMGVMILHVLCGKWPIPIPSRVDQGKQPAFSSEVELRERYLQQVESNHPLLELIRRCLDNEPPQRPTADQILFKIRKRNSQLPSSSIAISMKVNDSYGRVSRSAGLPMNSKGKERCSQEKESPSLSKKHLQTQNELSKALKRQKELELSHSVDMEQLKSRVSGLCTDVEGLRAVVKSKEKVVQAKESEKQQAIQTYEDAMKAMKAEKLEAIQSKETEKQQFIEEMETKAQYMDKEREEAIQSMKEEKEQFIQAIEREKQQTVKEMEEEKLQAMVAAKDAVQAMEVETQQAIEAKEIEKRQTIEAMNVIVTALQAEKQQVIEAKEKEKNVVVEAKEAEKQQAIQAKETEKKQIMEAKDSEKQQAIEAKETEKQQAIQAKETEKQQSIQAKETEKQQAIQAKETEKQQAVKAMEAIIHAKEIEKQENIRKLKEITQKMGTEKRQIIQQKEKEKQLAIQAKETEVQRALEAMEIEKQQALKEMQAEKDQAIKTMEAEKKQAIKSMEALVQLKEKQIEGKSLEMETKQGQIDSKQQEISLRSTQLEEKVASIRKIKEQTRRLQSYILSNEPLYTLTSLTRLHWSWKKLADMPVTLKWPQSVLIHDTAFVASRSNNYNVLKYDTKSDQWSILPPCPAMNFGLGQLSGKLIAVGGCAEIETLSGILGSCGISEINQGIANVYTYNEENQQWENVIPPMRTPRALPNVVSCGSVFAAFGGIGKNMLVEVFKGKKKGKWFTVAPLPEACAYMQVAVVNDRCYLGGGGLYISNRSLMSASLPSVFQSHMLPYCQTSSEAPSASVWTKLPDMPHYGSALASMGEVLVALGGCKYPISSDSPSSSLCKDDIHTYCPSTESWIKIGCLPQACFSATAERLPSGELLLIGGTDSEGNDTMDTYVGTLQLHV